MLQEAVLRTTKKKKFFLRGTKYIYKTICTHVWVIKTKLVLLQVFKAATNGISMQSRQFKISPHQFIWFWLSMVCVMRCQTVAKNFTHTYIPYELLQKVFVVPLHCFRQNFAYGSGRPTAFGGTKYLIIIYFRPLTTFIGCITSC